MGPSKTHSTRWPRSRARRHPPPHIRILRVRFYHQALCLKRRGSCERAGASVEAAAVPLTVVVEIVASGSEGTSFQLHADSFQSEMLQFVSLQLKHR